MHLNVVKGIPSWYSITAVCITRYFTTGVCFLMRRYWSVEFVAVLQFTFIYAFQSPLLCHILLTRE
jgi:hypothetical protein